jgi:hypothetical protein
MAVPIYFNRDALKNIEPVWSTPDKSKEKDLLKNANSEELLKKLEEKLDNLTQTELNNWVMEWLDWDLVKDIYRNWDDEVLKESLEELDEIISEREN